ncbi:hypothetical protein AB0J28_18475 [Streptosporangium canum]
MSDLPCPDCHGYGEVAVRQAGDGTYTLTMATCPGCNGIGQTSRRGGAR